MPPREGRVNGGALIDVMIDVMIVVAVIGILAALATPTFSASG